MDRLVEAIADGGSGFQAIRAKLTLEERNLRLLEHDLARVKIEIARTAGDPIDCDKLRHVLKDFDTLFAVASADERKELLQLLIKRIVFRGHDAEVTMELFSAVHLTAESSIFHTRWLRRRVSNERDRVPEVEGEQRSRDVAAPTLLAIARPCSQSDQPVVQNDPVTIGLKAALSAWAADRDVRSLSRALLRLLADLDA